MYSKYISGIWETFPDNVKDLGRVWRDTGLLDEEGRRRLSYTTWQKAFLR